MKRHNDMIKYTQKIPSGLYYPVGHWNGGDSMALIVQKFGGSSVADAEKIMRVAGIISDAYAQGHDVVVSLSAQGDTTDRKSVV